MNAQHAVDAMTAIGATASGSPANWLVAPLVIPLLAIGCLLLLWNHPRAQTAAATGAAVVLLGAAWWLLVETRASGALATRLGDWPAPVGIALGTDVLSALLVLLAAFVTLVVVVHGAGEDGNRAHRSPAQLPLIFVVILGVTGAFVTRDLFNLYVWFEVLLMGSFGLLVVGGGRDGVEAAVKALTLNLFGSLLFLVGVGITYGLAGTLDMADLQVRLTALHADRPAAVTAVAALLAVAFAIKSALFPLYFWLPASYHVPSAGICALFAALLTKVGVYSLLRLFTLPFAAVDAVVGLIAFLAVITMVSGVLGAVTQGEMKRILAWHSISQVGYMVAGVAILAAPDPEVRVLGIAAAVFFLVHHGLVKSALFLVAGQVERVSGTTHLRRNGGLLRTQPVLAVTFLLAALSLAGIPPLSGFWAKLTVIRAGVAAGLWWVVAAALGAGFLTLTSMLKIWTEAFWKPRPADDDAAAAPATRGRRDLRARAAMLALVLVVTLLGLYPRPLLQVAREAAVGALEPVRARATGTETVLLPSPDVAAYDREESP